jgi:6-phosphogluconolactonase
MSPRPIVHVLNDIRQWTAEAATMTLAFRRQAVEQRGQFIIALSGGRTPELVYRELASRSSSTPQAWGSTQFCFSDERCVPPDDVQSNYRLADEALFRPLHIPHDRIHRMRGEHPDASAAAGEYENVLRAVTKTAQGLWPQLDLVMLGVGNDGHTASLFPGTDALQERRRWVTVGQAPSGPPTRLTLTLGVINQATMILFLASGESKADIVKAILEPQRDADRQLPAALVRPERGRIIWVLDRAAAAKLTGQYESHQRPT